MESFKCKVGDGITYLQYNMTPLLLLCAKKVALFFEFFCGCVYIMHITFKTQEYDNNN